MKRCTTPLILLAIAWTAGAAPKVEESYDKFTDETRLMPEALVVTSSKAGSKPHLGFVVKYKGKQPTGEVSLFLMHLSFLRAGPPKGGEGEGIFLIDDKDRKTVQAERSTYKKEHNGQIIDSQSFTFMLGGEDLKRLASAKTVEVKVKGEEVRFTDEALETIRALATRAKLVK